MLEKLAYMYYPNIWSAMSTIGLADEHIAAQIGCKQQLLGAQGTFFHGFSWILQVFPIILHSDGFPWFSMIFMVSHGFSWVFMDFHGFSRFLGSWRCLMVLERVPIHVRTSPETNRIHIPHRTASY